MILQVKHPQHFVNQKLFSVSVHSTFGPFRTMPLLRGISYLVTAIRRLNMATLIGLQYLDIAERRRHNQVTEQDADLDRTSRESIAAKDRESRETIASLDRTSKENIASADRTSRERVASLDRVSREKISDAQLTANAELALAQRRHDAEQRDLDRQNSLDRIALSNTFTAIENEKDRDSRESIASGTLEQQYANLDYQRERDDADRESRENVAMFNTAGNIISKGLGALPSLIGGLK